MIGMCPEDGPGVCVQILFRSTIKEAALLTCWKRFMTVMPIEQAYQSTKQRLGVIMLRVGDVITLHEGVHHAATRRINSSTRIKMPP